MLQKDIQESSLKDYEDWVGSWADCMEDANGKGDTKGIYNAVKALARKQQKPRVNLTKNKHGKLLTGAEEAASIWDEKRTTNYYHYIIKSKAIELIMIIATKSNNHGRCIRWY